MDLCTGNGAVIRAVLESATKNVTSIELCGIDSAEIAPHLIADGHPQLVSHFVRGSVTNLPFSDCCFDVVTSQFGIEYAPSERTTAEAMRVLKTGGKGLFITHARGGVTAVHAGAEISDIAELLDEIEIFPVATEALTRVCSIERNPGNATASQAARAEHANKEFHVCLGRLGENWQKRAAFAVFRDTGSLLQHTYQNRRLFPINVLVDKVRETELSVILHRERLQALVDCALDSESCEQLKSAYRRHGARECGFRPIIAADGESQLGWAITVSK